MFLSILNDFFRGSNEENWMKQVTSPSVRHIYLSMYFHWSLFFYFLFSQRWAPPNRNHLPKRKMSGLHRLVFHLIPPTLKMTKVQIVRFCSDIIFASRKFFCHFILAQSELVCSRIEQVRVISNWLSKVIWICFGFALLRSVIGVKTRAMLWTNQTPNENQSGLGLPRFPAHLVVCLLWILVG